MDYELIEDINQRHKRKTARLEQELAEERQARVELEKRLVTLANEITFNQFRMSGLELRMAVVEGSDSDYACTEA